MSFSDIANLLYSSDLSQTMSNIVAFFGIITFVGLVFLFLAALCGVSRR